jgi:hypothetical protein
VRGVAVKKTMLLVPMQSITVTSAISLDFCAISAVIPGTIMDMEMLIPILLDRFQVEKWKHILFGIAYICVCVESSA